MKELLENLKVVNELGLLEVFECYIEMNHKIMLVKLKITLCAIQMTSNAVLFCLIEHLVTY